MKRIPAQSQYASGSIEMLQSLQLYFVEALSKASQEPASFQPIEWFRDQGQHGGGIRYVAADTPHFNRASVNLSQVHYDDTPDKALSSANALSSIIHPNHPLAPSVHIHISWTELRSGKGYWRIMADLNPAIANQEHKAKFETCLKSSAGQAYAEAQYQGNTYFYIPALKRHRGTSHFYLEAFNRGDYEIDSGFAQQIGKNVIDCYTEILSAQWDKTREQPSQIQKEEQLKYHTLYFFQVLTLDRGTTSGLLVHDQNDVGILGSLPSHIQRSLLNEWLGQLPDLQKPLLKGLMDALPEGERVLIDTHTKIKLAQTIREFYKNCPEALSLQASGKVIPPTVKNHR